MNKMTILQVILIAVAILYVILSVPDLAEKQEVDMYLTVGEHVGINVDQTAIWFGTVPPGGTSQRPITLANGDNFKKNVHFEAVGNISSWISLPEDAVIGASSMLNLTIGASVPEDADFGNYTGKLVIFFET